MLHSTVRLTVREQHRRDAVRTLRILRGHTSAKAGCLSFHVSQDVMEPSVLTVTERWATRVELEAHIRSADYKLLLAIIDLATLPPEIRFDAVEPVGGLDFVWAVRSIQPDDAMSQTGSGLDCRQLR